MKISAIILLTIIIIAAFLRLYNLTGAPPGLYPDEAMNGNNALEALATGDFSAKSGPALGWKVFYPENNGREGLFINIQALSLKLFGNEPWALRMVSAIFGILTVLGVYFLARELFGEAPNYKHQITNNDQNPNVRNPKQFGIWDFGNWNLFRVSSFEFRISRGDAIALLSSFFIATSFWHINFSRIGFRAIMAPAFLTWSLYFLLKSLNQVKNKSQEPSTKSQTISNDQNSNKQNPFRIFPPKTDPPLAENSRNWDLGFMILPILAGLLFGLGFHSYIAYRAMPALILIILAYAWFKYKEFRKKVALITIYFLLFTIIAAAPLGWYFLQNPGSFFGRTTQVSIWSSPAPLQDLGMNILKTAGMFNFFGDWNWRHNYAGRPELFWPVGILFILGLFLGLKMFFEKVSRRLSGHGFAEGEERSRESSGERLAGVRDRVFREEYFQSFLILFSWLIIAALPVVVSNEGIPHALRSLLMVPAVFILAGIGGVWLISRIKNYELRIMNGEGRKSKPIKIIIRTSLFIILSLLVFEAYYAYFINWAKNPNVQGAFSADYVQVGRDLNKPPKELPKYVVVEASGIEVRGIPMPAQTVMFITDTFTPEKQRERNVYYVLPNQISQIPTGAYVKYIR